MIREQMVDAAEYAEYERWRVNHDCEEEKQAQASLYEWWQHTIGDHMPLEVVDIARAFTTHGLTPDFLFDEGYYTEIDTAFLITVGIDDTQIRLRLVRTLCDNARERKEQQVQDKGKDRVYKDNNDHMNDDDGDGAPGSSGAAY